MLHLQAPLGKEKNPYTHPKKRLRGWSRKRVIAIGRSRPIAAGQHGRLKEWAKT